MHILRDEHGACMSRGQREQHVILQAREADVLMRGERLGQNAPTATTIMRGNSSAVNCVRGTGASSTRSSVARRA